jgi:hypothetical protein
MARKMATVKKADTLTKNVYIASTRGAKLDA